MSYATITMVSEQCCNCGIIFSMPEAFRNQCKDDNTKYFYCPNGHSQHFAQSTADKLQKQLDREKAEHARELERALEQKREVERQLKRIHKGTCPCCNRSFENLAKHMKTKHPEIIKAKPVKDIHLQINKKVKT